MSSVIKLRDMDAQLKTYFQNVLQDVEKTFDCSVSAFNVVLVVENGHCVVHHGNILVEE